MGTLGDMGITADAVERRMQELERLQAKETAKDAPFEGPWLPSEPPAPTSSQSRQLRRILAGMRRDNR